MYVIKTRPQNGLYTVHFTASVKSEHVKCSDTVLEPSCNVRTTARISVIKTDRNSAIINNRMHSNLEKRTTEQKEGKRYGRSLKAFRHLLQYWGTQRSQHAMHLEMCLEGVKAETHSSATKKVQRPCFSRSM